MLKCTKYHILGLRGRTEELWLAAEQKSLSREDVVLNFLQQMCCRAFQGGEFSLALSQDIQAWFWHHTHVMAHEWNIVLFQPAFGVLTLTSYPDGESIRISFKVEFSVLLLVAKLAWIKALGFHRGRKH